MSEGSCSNCGDYSEYLSWENTCGPCWNAKNNFKTCSACTCTYAGLNPTGVCFACKREGVKPLAMGGTKHDSGKPSLSYIPRCFLVGICKVMSHGAVKYGKWNYTKGFDETRILDAVLRHIFSHLAGEDLDPETGDPHLMHAACGLLMHAHCKELGTLTDDRFRKETA